MVTKLFWKFSWSRFSLHLGLPSPPPPHSSLPWGIIRSLLFSPPPPPLLSSSPWVLISFLLPPISLSLLWGCVGGGGSKSQGGGWRNGWMDVTAAFWKEECWYYSCSFFSPPPAEMHDGKVSCVLRRPVNRKHVRVRRAAESRNTPSSSPTFTPRLLRRSRSSSLLQNVVWLSKIQIYGSFLLNS